MPETTGGKTPPPTSGAKTGAKPNPGGVKPGAKPVSAGTKPGGSPSRPLATQPGAPLARPLAAKPTPPATGPRAPISVAKREARLARQRELQRRRSLITSSVVAAILVGLFAYLASNHFFYTPPAAKAKACATAPTKTPSAGASAPTLPTTLKTVTLPDGLKYIDITVGCGATAAVTDAVHVNYTGWILNGAQFDTSLQAGRTPLYVTLDPNFQSTGASTDPAVVIKGWQEGLVGMKVGGVRRIIIPPALGYGTTGAGTAIPPNATLVFDVALVSIP